ncbi:MAG: hypothetical protein QXU46_02450 [Candidatus Bathyarchaeia archaeon]
MRSPSNLGFKANPFPQHGVPPKVNVPFAAYPFSEFHENALEKWLKSLYDEKRPSCYLFVGEFGSGKSHLSNIIRSLAVKNGYDVKEEFFRVETSLYDTIFATEFKKKRTIILFDEVQGLYDTVRRNPDAISNFKIQLRNFLEGKKEAVTEEGFANVTILLFCTPQVKDTILHEEDMSQRFMLTVKPLPVLDPYIGLRVAKNFLQAYADKSIVNTKLKMNPYYPFDRYTVLSLINLCPYVVEKKGASYRPTTRFLVELLRHCFDYILSCDLDTFTFKELPSALKETKILEMTVDLSPNVHKVEEIAQSPPGKAVAQFLGSALGWWTIPEISKACNLTASEVKRVLHEELAPIVNAEQCWILSYETAEKNIKGEIKKLGKRYEERIESIFSIPWVTANDEPCYLIVPSLHLIDDAVERIFKKFNARQENIYWLKNTLEIFHVALEGRFRKFSVEQLEVLREFLDGDSISREQKILGQLKIVVTHAHLKEASLIEPAYEEYGNDALKVLGLKVTPHAATPEIYYRVGLKFICVPPSGIIDDDFRKLVEGLKTSASDFVIVFTYPEFLEYKRLEPYMQENIKWAPAYKRIFIKNLTEADLVTILTDPATFAINLEGLTLDAIRDFNEGMLSEYLLMPLYGLKWALKRLNPNDETCIYPKLVEKWFTQMLNDIKDNTVREFIETYKKPYGPVEFEDGEVIQELLDRDKNIVISEYERKVYQLLENQYRIEKSILEEEINRAFVSGALYKLKQAGITPYQFIVEILLASKNLVKISPEFEAGRQKIIVTTRKISEEKQSVLNLITSIKKDLQRQIEINFDGETFVFNNNKYISKITDKLELLENYVKEIQDNQDLLKKAIVLTQLYYITRSIENLRAEPQDSFSSIIRKIQEVIGIVESAKIKINDHLARASLHFTPKSVLSVNKNVKKSLSKISKLIEDGRLIELIEKEISVLEGLAKDFDGECDQVALMLINGEVEIQENNEKARIIGEKKDNVHKMLDKIKNYKLGNYFASAPTQAEKDFFKSLYTFLTKIELLEKPMEISQEELKSLIEALEKTEFKIIIKRYQDNVRSIRDKTVQIYEQYSISSNEFLGKSDTLVSALERFWPQRMKELEEDMQMLKAATDGVSRAHNLVEFYHKMIDNVGNSGLKIAHAIAFEFLEPFLFIEKMQPYAERLEMTLKEFSEGLEVLKKKGILKEGVG